MVRPSCSTSERLLGVALSGVVLVAASASILPSAAHAEWRSHDVRIHGGAALYGSPAHAVSAPWCGGPMALPPLDPMGPRTIHSLPPIVYGPYRGPDLRAGRSNLLRRTSCVRAARCLQPTCGLAPEGGSGLPTRATAELVIEQNAVRGTSRSSYCPGRSDQRNSARSPPSAKLSTIK